MYNLKEDKDMKKEYISPSQKVMMLNMSALCAGSIVGNKVSMDNSDDNAVGAGASLGRGGFYFEDDEE